MLRSCGICLNLKVWEKLNREEEDDFRVRILNKDAEVRMEGETYVQVQERAVQIEVKWWSSLRSR